MATAPFVRSPVAVLVLCAAGALVLGATGIAPLDQRSPNQQRVVISVVDKKGVPVATLTPADLTIEEDRIAREVISVEPATSAMDIAILVDTSVAASGAIVDLRKALRAFSKAIWARSPDTQIALYSFGERVTLDAGFSSSVVNLDRRIGGLLARAGSGAYFIDAVIEAAAALRKRAPARPVIVAYVDENGPELSHRRHKYVDDAVAAARASLWTVARMGFDHDPSLSNDAERAKIMGDVPTRSGGRNTRVLGSVALVDRFTQVAHQLLAQFVVTYGRPEVLVPPDRLEIRLTNSDLRLAAPQWTSR